MAFSKPKFTRGSTGSAFLLNPRAAAGVGALVNGYLDPGRTVGYPADVSAAVLAKFGPAPAKAGGDRYDAPVAWTQRVLREYVLPELARRGVSREQAYEWVQRNAMRSFHESTDFKTLLLADADVTRVLAPAEIERAFDLGDQLRHVDDIFDRVFGAAAGAAG